MTEVDIILRKYDGRPHRWVTAQHLGEDSHGTWLSTPTGTEVHYSYGRAGSARTTHDAIRLIPHSGWWIAMFTAPPGRSEIYCDVALPPSWTTPAEVVVVDLDLDVLRTRAEGRVEVEDEDEFAEHTLLFGYPPEVVARATATAADLRRALLDHTEPFGTAAAAWFQTAGLGP